MGNLVRGARHILVPNLSAKDFGLYTATSRNSLMMLTYRGKDGSISFPGVDTDGNYPYLKRAMFGVGKAARKASRLMELIAPAPCDDCNYEAGLNIAKDVNYNGEQFNTYDEVKYYYGHLPSIQSTVDGELADADKLEILGQIIEMINNDRKAMVNASIAYIVTNDDDTDASTITVNGTTVSLGVSDVTADEVNAADAGVLAYQLEDTATALLVPEDHGFFPVIEGTDTSVLNFYLKLDDRYENEKVKINWELDSQKWEAISHIHTFQVAYSGGDGIADIDIDIDGDTYSGTNAATGDINDTVAAIVEDLRDASADIAISQDTANGVVNIAVINGNEVTVTEGAANAITVAISEGFGVFQEETLTGEWLRKKHFGHEAGTIPSQPVVQPDPDAKYVMLMIELKAPTYDNVLPDVMHLDQRCYYFYIKESDLTSDHWSDADLMLDEPATADIDAHLFELLHGWVGSRPDGGAADAAIDLTALDEDWLFNNLY